MNAFAPLNPLSVNVRVIALPSRRQAPASRSRASAASSSRVSSSGSAIATNSAERTCFGTGSLREQTPKAEADHDPAAEVHAGADEKWKHEDASAEERTGCERPESVREPPHREARADRGRALLGDRRGHQQRLVKWPREIRKEAADHEEPRGDDEDGSEHEQSETRAACR